VNIGAPPTAMKSALSVLPFAAAMGGLGRNLLGHQLSLFTINHRPLSQSPTYNQRKARKSRRQRFANGDRHAFRR